MPSENCGNWGNVNWAELKEDPLMPVVDQDLAHARLQKKLEVIRANREAQAKRAKESKSKKKDYYETINDAAELNEHLKTLCLGDTEIWFAYDHLLPMRNFKPKLSHLASTHKWVGKVQEDNIEKIFCFLQQEVWAPDKKGFHLAENLGISRLSMVPNDVIVRIEDGKRVGYMVSQFGFDQITE